MKTSASGSEPLQYQWFKDGLPLSGKTEPTISIETTSISDGGDYYAKVVNQVGQSTSSTASVDIGEKPNFQFVSSPVTTHASNSAIIWSQVSGDGDITYEWLRDGNIIKTTSKPWVILSDLPAENIGTFQIKASSQYGTQLSDVVLTRMVDDLEFDYPSNPSVTRLLPGTITEDNKLDVYLAVAGFGGEEIFIIERIPEGINVESVADGGKYNPSSRTITWNLPSSGSFLLSYSAVATTEYSIDLDFTGESLVENETLETGQNIIKGKNYKPIQWVDLPESGIYPVGDAITLNARADGIGSVSYSWYFNGNPIQGENQNNLMIPSAVVDQSGVYQVVAQDIFGSVVSPEFNIDVLEAPTILVHPRGAKVATGDSINLEVSASGGGKLNYQWFRNDLPLSGEMHSALLLDQLSPTEDGFYKVVISNKVGSVTSEVAKITVGFKPEIQLISSPVTFFDGHTGLLWAQVSSESRLRYIWKKDEKIIFETDVPWFHLEDLSSNSDGRFQLHVENEFGTASYLDIDVKPVSDIQYNFTKEPSVTRLNPPLFKQGKKHDVYLALNGLEEKEILIVEKLPEEIKFESVNDGGYYDDKSHSITWNLPASGNIFISYSVSVTGTDNPSPNFSGESIWDGSLIKTRSTIRKDNDYEPLRWVKTPHSQKVALGSPLELEALAEGSGPISYSWSFNGSLLAPDYSNKLILPNTLTDQSGVYQVSANNVYGTITSPEIFVEVLTPPSISQLPEGELIALGDTLKLAVFAKGSHPLEFQWLKDGIPLVGKTSELLTIKNITEKDAGDYQVSISNDIGQIISEAVKITTGQKPEITFISSEVTAHVGHSALIWARASGDTPMEYEWKWEGSIIGSSDKPFILLDSISDQDLGSFQLTVRNNLGSTTSQVIKTKIAKDLEFNYSNTPSVTRILPDSIPEDKTLDIYIAFSGMSGEKVFTIERLPKDLKVDSVRDGGRYDSKSHTITWDLPTSDNFLISYSGSIIEGDSDKFEFDGESLWGDEVLPTIGKQVLGNAPTIFADNDPTDYIISASEANQFVSSYLNDEVIEDELIPLEYAVRVLTIHNSGGGYEVDQSMTPPLSWSPNENTSPRDLQQNSAPTELKPEIYFIGQAIKGQSLQLVVDMPERIAEASGIELRLNQNWSWAKDEIISTAKWIFPNADMRYLVVDVYPVIGSDAEELKVSGLFSVDGELEQFGSSTSVSSQLPSSITSARIENNKVVISGTTEIAGKWVIESTSDFVTWSKWQEFENSTTNFEITGDIENVSQQFFRVRFIR